MSGKRLDHQLVALGQVTSRSRATRLIREGQIKVNGKVVIKPAQLVLADAQIDLISEDRYVGRGGEKLAGALSHFNVRVAGKHCLDVGASTGGFTDCLLQHGASQVLALDVGHGQMDPSLLSDPRVRNLEGVNARYLEPRAFGEVFELLVADVSFISLTLVLPGMTAQAAPNSELIALIKPQFELGSDALNKKGVVRTDTLRQQAVQKVVSWFQSAESWKVAGVMDSPITGGDGNQEYLIYAKRSQAGFGSGQPG